MRAGTIALVAAAALSISPTVAHTHSGEEPAETTQVRAEFVGRYDGSAMETAMGMIIREDGTFAWGISVGALDLRAQGTWSEVGGTIVFANDPKPVPPEFRWTGTAEKPGSPFLMVQLPNGRQLEYIDVYVRCEDTSLSFNTIPEGGLVLDSEACTEPNALALELPVSINEPQVFDLEEQGWTSGQTILIEFHRNDFGVADFDGVTGQLEGDMLRVEGPLGAMELRKIVPQND